MKNLNQYQVMIPNNETKHEMFAAQEFIYFYEYATGFKLIILHEQDTDINKPFISIGYTSLLKDLTDTKSLLTSVGEDGYQIISKQKFAAICGGNEYGTMYGVYRFLNLLFNLKIYSDIKFVCDKTNSVCLPNISISEKPDIPLRSIGIYPVYYYENTTYQYRMRLRAFCDGWGMCLHSYFRIVPPAKYKAEHSEWYTKDGLTICLTNAGLKVQFVDNMKEIIEKASPNDKIFMLGQEDSVVFCDCEQCKNQLKKYDGSGSAVMMEFTNDVVRELNKWLKTAHPDREVIFCTFAYLKTSNPPVKKDDNGNFYLINDCIKAEPNLAVMLAPIHSNSSYSYFDYRNMTTFETNYHSKNSMPTADMFYGWKKVTDLLFVWSYMANYVDYICPFFMWEGLDENYRKYKELEVYYIFNQGTHQWYLPNLTELKIYVVSQLMWDSTQNINTLINDFMLNYYGDGHKALLSYFNLMNQHKNYIEKNFNRKALYVRFDDYEDIANAKFWPKEVLENALKLFDKALALKLTDEYYWRVLGETMPVKYMLMLFYRNEMTINERKELISDLKNICEHFRINNIRDEEPSTMSAYFEIWEKEMEFAN